MQIRKPSYYDEFRCLAGKCPDSCCQDWDVLVDEIAAARYRAMPGALGERLRQVMYEEDGQTYFAIQSDGRCPMWRDDGLCRIQAEQGEQALCQVCANFPRLRHDFGDFVELGLELSCPEAARLILNAAPQPWLTENVPGGEGDYDKEAMTVLQQARQEALELLADSHYTVPEALAVLLVHGYRCQQWLDEGEGDAFDADSALDLARQMAQTGGEPELREFFRDLEILTPRWRERLDKAGTPGAWTARSRAMARYFVERYYLQAVSDYDLVGRVKLTVVSCLLVHLLGGNLEETAQLYSKEIENDADNVDTILAGAYMSPALTDAKLLGMLLEK